MIVRRIVFCFVIAMLLLYIYRLCAYLEVGNNLCDYKVVFSMNMSCFYFPQWRCLICQWNARCDDAISINRSINLIIDYFNNRLIDFNRLIVAALPTGQRTSNSSVTHDIFWPMAPSSCGVLRHLKFTWCSTTFPGAGGGCIRRIVKSEIYVRPYIMLMLML